MPYQVAIQCPDCAREALFAFFECVEIRFKKDIEYFKQSPLFEYRKVIYDGVGVNLACYYHRLSQNSLPDITDLPDGYSMADWEHGFRYRMYGFNDGTIVCHDCGHRKKHVLSWPGEAYFQIEYKQKMLWAYDRDSTVELLDYICSKNRDRARYKYRSFLLHLPAHFQAQNARAHIIKYLSAKLLSKT